VSAARGRSCLAHADDRRHSLPKAAFPVGPTIPPTPTKPGQEQPRSASPYVPAQGRFSLARPVPRWSSLSRPNRWWSPSRPKPLVEPVETSSSLTGTGSSDSVRSDPFSRSTRRQALQIGRNLAHPHEPGARARVKRSERHPVRDRWAYRRCAPQLARLRRAAYRGGRVGPGHPTRVQGNRPTSSAGAGGGAARSAAAQSTKSLDPSDSRRENPAFARMTNAEPSDP
jgi:hypothetical protein